MGFTFVLFQLIRRKDCCIEDCKSQVGFRGESQENVTDHQCPSQAGIRSARMDAFFAGIGFGLPIKVFVYLFNGIPIPTEPQATFHSLQIVTIVVICALPSQFSSIFAINPAHIPVHGPALISLMFYF